MTNAEHSPTFEKRQRRPARPKQRLTARALLDIKRLSDPRIHPDGQRVAFVVTEADFEESRWVSHLWVTELSPPDNPAAAESTSTPEPASLSSTEPAAFYTETTLSAPKIETADGKAEGTDKEEKENEENENEADPSRQLTFSYDGESHPRWSPDGRFLAFLSTRPDDSEPPAEDEDDPPKEQIWLLPGDGGEARRLTHAREGILDYAWTPDSSAIVYLASEPRPRPIESVRKDDRHRRKIDPVVEHEDRLRRQFWRVDVEERKPKLLFTGDYGVLEFALSPNGQSLCYATNYTGLWNDYHLVDIFVRDLTDGTVHKLVERPGGKYHLRWSPDGTQIAFLSWLDPQLSYSRQSLFVADSTKKEITDCRLLTEDSFDYDIAEFEWSRHNRIIYALAATGTASEIFRILADSGRYKGAMETPGEREDLALDSESSAFVYVQETAAALPEIFLRDDFGRIHQLTKLNAEFAENYHLPRQEVVQWTGTDGTPIEGVLVYPLHYQEPPSDLEGKRYPLIVQVHGGPKGRATHTLRGYYLHPLWASEGYAVLLPNFRGSEGYGNAFAIANRRDLGGGDFQDIMAGVDWCVEKGLADPDRLGIMGGSYGGYMTNWAIGHTDRFRAAISMFGIFHLQTDYSNSELSRWDHDYLGAYYWEDPEIYRRLSPGSYVDNIKTPTLILHGDDDNNTFISNSKELYQVLLHRGVKTQFVHYPREGHGLQEPNHRLDEMRRCLAWMDRFVRHGGENPGLYRVSDRIPHPDGLLELCVTRVETVTFAGQPEATKQEGVASASLLEVAFTLHRLEADTAAAPVTLRFEEIRLEVQAQALFPVGLPFEGPGGKTLVEGENLRMVHFPDHETGQLAFAGAAIFRVPGTGGEGQLRFADFPAVVVFWSPPQDEEEKSDTKSTDL